MAEIPKTAGVVLAGGLARRMGGGDKPLQSIGGTTLLERIVGIMRPQCVRLVLNANGDASRFPLHGLAVIPDAVPGFAGPLAGILAALDWTAQHEPDAEWVVSVAGDAPFLPGDLVVRFHEAIGRADALVAQAETNGRAHPVNALWNVGLRGPLRRALVEEGQRKVEDFSRRHGVVNVIWPSEPVDPFFNANTVEDLAEAERLLGRLP